VARPPENPDDAQAVYCSPFSHLWRYLLSLEVGISRTVGRFGPYGCWLEFEGLKKTFLFLFFLFETILLFLSDNRTTCKTLVDFRDPLISGIFDFVV